MDARGYLDETAYAVRRFYAGIEACHKIYERAEKHWNLSMLREPPTEERRERARKFVKQAEKYFALDLSEGTLAGAVLQVAATGIRIFSTNRVIPDDCTEIVPPDAKRAIPFCIGKRMYGLPVGLIIYAGRNQYAHWEVDPYPVTENVFRRLVYAFWDNPFYDLAFDLDPDNPSIYANRILLGALDWRTYEKYRKEMEELLCLEGA